MFASRVAKAHTNTISTPGVQTWPSRFPARALGTDGNGLGHSFERTGIHKTIFRYMEEPGARQIVGRLQGNRAPSAGTSIPSPARTLAGIPRDLTTIPVFAPDRKHEAAGSARVASGHDGRAITSALKVAPVDDPMEREADRTAERVLQAHTNHPQPRIAPHRFSSVAFPIQAKLKVGAVNDPLEREADGVANQVMGMQESDTAAMKPASVTGVTGRSIHRCAACEEEQEVHAKAKNGGAATPSRPPHGAVSRVLRSSGRQLDSQTRAFMETRFGRDFGDVRVHTDGEAARSAGDLGARAYTVGKHLVFAPGKFSPATVGGKWLLAHELTHVVQQSIAVNRRQPLWRVTPANAPGQFLQRAPDSSERIREKILEDKAEFAAKVESNLAQIASGADYMKTSKFATLPRETQLTWVQIVMGQCKVLQFLIDSHDDTIAAEIRWEQAAEHAEDAQRIAEKSVARAARWRNRLSSYVKSILHTVESVIVCPLSETGIGAVGCIHATTALYADLQTISSGEPQRNAFEQSGYGVAKALGLNEQQANQAAFAVDFAGGAASSLAPLQKGAYLAQLQNNAYASARSAAQRTLGSSAGSSVPGILGRTARNLSFATILGRAQVGAAGPAETALINQSSRTSVTLVEGRVASAIDELSTGTNSAPKAVTASPAAVPGATVATTVERALASAMPSARTISPVLGHAATISATLPSVRGRETTVTQPHTTPNARTVTSTLIHPRIQQARNTRAFAHAALQAIRNTPGHLLKFLLDGSDWRKTTRVTRQGNTQVGRYEGNEHGVVVQIGHRTARMSGAAEQFGLEDADFNQVDNNVIESVGNISQKLSIVIQGVTVDIRSAMHWERLELLPRGTVAASPQILPPAVGAPN